mgnify:CR=1 FL=1
MTDTRFQPVDAPERETAKEPPKRWRNWYRFYALPHLGLPEEIRHGKGLWPSKQVAEQKALDQIAINAPEYRALGFEPEDCEEYLGAFPEGERPQN